MPLRLLQHGDSEYPGLCAAWNAAIVHRPAYVAVAETAEQVAEAVVFAAQRGLRVRVQATGHGALRPATEDDLLLVTSGMDTVAIDGDTALVGPGAKWKAVIDAAHPHGLAPLVGSTSDVGVVGYSLGGGLGFLARPFGLAAQAIVELQLVTADGEIRWVDDQRDPGLMAALRGFGPNLGVVTALRTRLFPAAQLYAGSMMWPADLARDVLLAYRDWVATVPRELTSAVGVLHVPDAPFVPPPMRGQSVARICLCHPGPDHSGMDELLAPLRALPGLVMDLTGPMPSNRIDEITADPTDPLPFMLRAEMLAGLSDEAIDYLAGISPRDAEPYLLWLVRHIGGAPQLDPGLAYAQGEFVAEAVSLAPGPDVAAAVQDFGGRFSAGLGAAATGYTPFNFAAGLDQIARAFTPEYGARLAETKRRLDPAGLFGGERTLTA
ncbi:FAD-binding oxidoreductase [Nonomuraea sp. NPDC050328]|uniref:FAD-binding oxidoreductase n=1 Tax=Nonomuraea sp. NPDC050328 TaxID=3364361 RepID=UPI0037A9A735